MKNALAEHGTALAAGGDAAREEAYFQYLINVGCVDRWGPGWRTDERIARLQEETFVIQKAGFHGAFIMLADLLAFCRRENIPYGPGRGSVGGSLVCYVLGIHDVDPLEWGLLFERFMNPDRVSFPDVDLDISQKQRDRVIQYIVNTYNRDGQIVLQIGAFVRAGGRAVVDLLLAAMARSDPQAGATATNLKRCFPEKGNITGGLKVQRELAWWLEKGHGDKAGFKALAEQAGWLDHMMELDGMMTHLGKHAAGTLILREDDLPWLPQASNYDADLGHRRMVSAYDMYTLDDLGYPKWDILGLRTLDVVTEAHKFEGGSGAMRDLLAIWQEHRDDPEPYEEVMQTGDMLGVFQMDTPGYTRTVKAMKPTCFDHIVQLVALYRPGAIDYVREDGKNMVDVFIERHHGREAVTYEHELLKPILRETHGIILYQEQAMRIVRDLGGFTRGEADSLRKAIGKKRPEELAKLKPKFVEGCRAKGIADAIIERIFTNIEAAGRYSWNKSHAVEYGIITWWTVWFKYLRTGLYCAEINSWEEKKEKQAVVISEARQHVDFRPPDVNIAEDRFTVAHEMVNTQHVDSAIVFGLNGIRGMGDANRSAIMVERAIGGYFTSFEDFSVRLPSLPINMKMSLIACGAFDQIDDRVRLLASVPKGTPYYTATFECGCTQKRWNVEKYAKICNKHSREVMVIELSDEIQDYWTVAEHLNHNRTLKNPKPLPPMTEWSFPTDADLAAGEMEAMGYYISKLPLAHVHEALRRCPAGHIGGEVHSVKIHQDRNQNDMATLQVTTPDLTRQRVRVFASNYRVWGDQLEKGAQFIFRGREDDGTFLADAAFAPGDYRHFKIVKLTRDGSTAKEPYDGKPETLAAYEQAGYTVRFL